MTLRLSRRGAPVLDGFDLTIPAGIVARHRRTERRRQDHARQAAVPPVRPAVRRHRDRRHRPARVSTSTRGGRGVTAVFQDFIRFELPLRDNVAPAGAPDDVDASRARRRRAPRTWRDSTPCWRAATTAAPTCRAGSGSASRWRARCAPCELGAGVVLLDEPTAQLDVRGEAEIFERILAATRHCTTILISHRFSTVRHADRICVLEHGKVVELGTHDELMALSGRYRTMFDLQAQRFSAPRGRGGGDAYDVLA